MKASPLPELASDADVARAAAMREAYRASYNPKSTVTPVSKETEEVQKRLNVKRSIKAIRGHHKQDNLPYGNFGEREALRRQILSLSLFPNLYNRAMIYAEAGPD
jgi:hypothetical protein